MALFDPNTVAVVDDIPEESGINKAPEETGKAMLPHDPANVAQSQDDIINFENVLEIKDEHEAVGSDSIFSFNHQTANPSNESHTVATTKVEDTRQNEFNNFFASLESSLVVTETGVNPEVTSSDFNPQMAVIPLNDPSITKTGDDIKDGNGVYLDNEIGQDPDVKPFDETNAFNLINNIRSISQESLLPVNIDDGVAYADIIQDEQYVDAYIGALQDAEQRIADVKSEIHETGGIDKAMAVALENIQPGILSKRISIESFTSYPSKTNLVIALEASDNWVMGAKVVGGAVLFGLIVKMLLWIREKLSGAIQVSDKEINAAKQKKDNIVKTINDIARDNIDIIRTNPNIVKNINARCSALLKSDYKVKVDNIAEANNVFLQQYTHQEFKNYNKLQAIIIANKNVNSAMEHSTKFLLDKLKELEVKFTNYENAFRSTNIMDSSQYKTNWSEAEKILKELGFENKPADTTKIGDYMRNVITTLSKTKNAIPTYEALSTNSYSPDHSHGLDDVKRNIETLLKKVTKLSEDHTTFPDKEIGSNREVIGKVLKDEVSNLMGISLSVLAIRNSGNAVSKKLINVVKLTDDSWKAVFKGTPIKYGQ